MTLAMVTGRLARFWSNPAGLVIPALLLTLIIFLYPVGSFLLRGFNAPEWGFQNYAAVLNSPIFGRVIWNTVVISASVTGLCILIGYPFAYSIAMASPRLRRILLFVVLVPLWTSMLVRTFAWMILLQNNGIVNSLLLKLGITNEPVAMMYNRTGVLIGMTQVLLPFFVLPLYAVMNGIQRNLTAAASTLGAPPVSNFLRIYLPLSMPGLISGAILVFVMSMGYFITPALLGGRTDVMISQIIQREVADFGRWETASALAGILLLSVAICFVLMRLLTHRRLAGNPGI